MNKKILINKLTAITIIISMVLFVVSCSIADAIYKKGENDRVISADSPWFDSVIIDVDPGINSERSIEDLHPKLAGADDKYIVVFVDGYYRVDWSKVTTNSDWAIKNIVIIDRKTNQPSKTINLYSVPEIGKWPDEVIYSHGQIIVKCNWWDKETNTKYDKDVYIDPESLAVLGTQKFPKEQNVYFSNSYDVGDYRIETIFHQSMDGNFYRLRIYTPNSDVKEVDIKIRDKDIYGIPEILAIDSTTALVPVAMERDYRFFKLDLNSYSVFEVDSKDFEWLDIEQIKTSINGFDGKAYFTTNQGVSSLDINSRSVEQIFDFSWCGVNRKYFRRPEIAGCSDNSLILCSRYNASAFGGDYIKNFVVIILTKADKNPHAGKRIIELYTPDGKVDESISDAIIRYNETNSSFFIDVSDRFNRRNYINSTSVNSIDDYDSLQFETNSNLSNDLAMALMNGEGPDILMNTSELGLLNNDKCLVDLSPYLTDLNSDKYFVNIINGAKTDGKLYQLPISFTIEGIQTDPEYAGLTGCGFTTNEYEEFLYEVLNGKDVIESGQNLYFAKVFNGMSDRFISGSNVNFDNLEFVSLAEYVKNNVPEKSASWDVITDDSSDQVEITNDSGNKTAYYCVCPGISGYFVKRSQIKNGSAILGIPSADGRGPMFGANISIAISKCAVDVNACMEFVKMILSEDIQNELVMRDMFVVNRDAFRLGGEAAIVYFNSEEGSQNLYDYAAGTYVKSRMEFTLKDLDNLENTILNCSILDSTDSAINKIIIEEMPAYFSGQKDLSSVVAIMQDRAQKVLNERG